MLNCLAWSSNLLPHAKILNTLEHIVFMILRLENYVDLTILKRHKTVTSEPTF